ncbi:MAG: alpha/beta hydrolase [Pseudomonadota bacterium]
MRSLPVVTRTNLAGPAGALESVVEVPKGVTDPAAFLVVCHPHPLHGGTMDNKVVTTLARSAHEIGVPSLRFNFRGVGASVGSFDEGRGETQDALAVVAHGRQLWPDAVLWLAGFSFGGVVALRASTTRGVGKVDRLLTVAPALGHNYESPRQITVPDCPWLIVQGDADDVVDAHLAQDWSALLDPQPQFVMLPGVGHFFHGKLTELAQHAGRFFLQP